MIRLELKTLFHYLISEGLNILNERLLFYIKRKKFGCPLCNQSSSYFIHFSNKMRIAWNSACPSCNSRSRHRGLFFLYQDFLSGCNNKHVLHFAPEPVLSAYIKNVAGIDYKTSDFFLQDVDFPGEDIQKLNFQNESVDVVFCNHVIEHVPHDEDAVKEMARILKTDGLAIVTIPGDWNRRETITFSDLSFNGHYRDYGLDVVDLLNKHFTKVVVRDLHDFNLDAERNLERAIRSWELAFICYK